MVFAQREDIDILYNDQLIVVLMKNSSIDQISHVLFIAFCEVEHGLCISLGSFPETLSFWILPDTFENGLHSSGEFLNSLLSLFRRRLQPCPRAGT